MTIGWPMVIMIRKYISSNPVDVP